MNYYVYEITNLINGRKYIGKRSCHCSIENDKYMGSGVLIKNAITKYGIENFKKDILMICDSEEQAYAWEDFYTVKNNAWENKKYYNLRRGGKGGNVLSEESKKKISIANKGRKPTEKALEINRTKNSGVNNAFYGKKHTHETRKKISESLKGKPNKYKGKKMSEEYRKKSKETQLKYSAKKVVLMNTLSVFDSIQDAGKYLGLKYPQDVGRCCMGKIKSAGKINGERAIWKYYEDYIKECNNENK